MHQQKINREPANLFKMKQRGVLVLAFLWGLSPVSALAADDFFENDACIVGKIFVDCNHNQLQEKGEFGIPGVRIYMEDGTYIISDAEGKYNLCGIRSQTHVLKIDSLTLPRGSRLNTSSNRNTGDAGSLFLDSKHGTLMRADFIEGSCAKAVLEQVRARRTQGEVHAPKTENKGAPAIKMEGKSPYYLQQTKKDGR